MKYGDCTYDEYIESVEAFHGTAAPDLLLGWYMVRLAGQIPAAGSALFGIQRVQAPPQHLKKAKPDKVAIGPARGESYPESHGPNCRGCSQDRPYGPIADSEKPTSVRLPGASSASTGQDSPPNSPRNAIAVSFPWWTRRALRVPGGSASFCLMANLPEPPSLSTIQPE